MVAGGYCFVVAAVVLFVCLLVLGCVCRAACVDYVWLHNYIHEHSFLIHLFARSTQTAVCVNMGVC